MLGFVQSWFKPGANPVGIDFGTDTLRMAQVEFAGGDFNLVAAASADVPPHIRHEPSQRLEFFVETVRELMVSGGFRGRRRCSPCRPRRCSCSTCACRGWTRRRRGRRCRSRRRQAADRPVVAVLRHVVAGEVYQDQEPKHEVVLMAASRDLVNQLLAAANKARLDVVGMNVEPKALVDCFGHVYRRKTDAEMTTCFVDIGAAATRAVVARGTQILFARVIPIGGDHFNRAVATAMKLAPDDAKVLRIKLAHVQPLSADVAPPVPRQVLPLTLLRRSRRAAATERTRSGGRGRTSNSFALLVPASAPRRRTSSRGPRPPSDATGCTSPPAVLGSAEPAVPAAARRQ
jgi:hypothetical protein